MLTVVYRSESVALLPFSELTDICLKSAMKNQRLGITGFLVEWEGVFLQVLEGPDEAVATLYDRIREDSRHRDVETLLYDAGHDRPSFVFWAMNFGPLNDGAMAMAVLGDVSGVEEFRRRTHEPDFALEVLSRAYAHACEVADVDSIVKEFIQGAIPNFTEVA